MTRSPLEVIPQVVAEALKHESYWFVIGGQAVRCFVPYRPTHDVDFGVTKPAQLKRLLKQLESTGKVELIEKSADTVHLNFGGVDISIFLLPKLGPHVDGQTLTLTGLLATKAHAILDRGTRRDFFDLYVLLEAHHMGLSDVLRALAEVYQEPLNQGLMLRALSYFEDAAAEAPLPGEGPGDFEVVKEFFSRAVGALVVPPGTSLKIQAEQSPKPALPTAGRLSKPARTPRKK
jgi:hypothetical protein